METETNFSKACIISWNCASTTGNRFRCDYFI